MFSNFRVFVISFHFHFPKRKIAKRITKTRTNESTKKCGLLRDSLPTPHRLDRAASETTEQKRDWLRASRCLSRFCSVKQRTATDQPAPNNGCGGDPFSIHSKMSKINCRRQNKTGTGSELRGACPAFVPANQAESARKLMKRKWYVDQPQKQKRCPDRSTYYSFTTTFRRLGSASQVSSTPPHNKRHKHTTCVVACQ